MKRAFDPRIAGVIPPMVTPFDSEGKILEDAHRAEVRRLIGAGVHGLAVCGSTGEGHTLTSEETRRITAWTVEEARGRVPVIAGIITDSTQLAIERARAVSDLGVAALQVTPVHYLFRPDDDAMARHFAALADACGLPVIIYNVVPWSYLSPALLVRILRDVDGVMGVKQSASDMKTLADLLLLIEEAGGEQPPSPASGGKAGRPCSQETVTHGFLDSVRILSAVDALLYPSFSLGAHGTVAAIVTAAPEWCVELWNAVAGGDHARALALHKKLLRLWNAIDAPNLPANVKTAMAVQGREGGAPRAPMPASSPEQAERIRRALAAGRGTL